MHLFLLKAAQESLSESMYAFESFSAFVGGERFFDVVGFVTNGNLAVCTETKTVGMGLSEKPMPYQRFHF